jgi:hypothetical protein
MLFYAFEMAVAIAFLRINAVEAIQIQNHRNRAVALPGASTWKIYKK